MFFTTENAQKTAIFSSIGEVVNYYIKKLYLYLVSLLDFIEGAFQFTTSPVEVCP